MGLLPAVLWVLRRRFHQSWGLLAVTSFGILATVTLMATGALYSGVLADAGLSHALAVQPPEVLDVQIIAQNRPLGPDDYRSLRELAEDSADFRVGHLLRGTERMGQTQANLLLTTNPAPVTPPLGSPAGRPFFLTGFQEHSRLTEGRWPATPGRPVADGVQLETVIGARTARETGFAVGSAVYVVPIQGLPAQRITLNVVGLAEAVDPREEYWLSSPVYFRTGTVGEQTVVPFYVTEEDFLNVLGARFPTLVGDFGFLLFLDPSRLTASTAGDARRAMLGLETDLNKRYPRTLVLSRLDRTIDEFGQALKLARVPLYLFISLVVVVILYFLALITGILGRSQTEEAGLLRSRGASVVQVSGVLALAEALVALVAVAIGPLLAWLIVRFLLSRTIDPAGDASISVGVSAGPFLMGAAGAALAVGVLLVTAAGRARLGMVESLSSRARPPSVPFLHRYYLDLLAVAAVALIWWQVRGRDGFVAQELASRGIAVDPTLILGPVLGLFAAAVLLLRVLPLLVRVLAWLGDRGGPASVRFSLLRLARDPIPHGSLAVILMLAAALGVFGATFQSSLSQGQREQALYRAGGDLVVTSPSLPSDAAERAGSVPGIMAASPVLRDSATVLSGGSGSDAQLIAVEPGAFAQAAWFRDDFADLGLAELAGLLETRHPAMPSPVLPADAQRAGIWVDFSRLGSQNIRGSVNLWLRVRDATGRYRNILMGNLVDAAKETHSGDSWTLFTGELPAAAEPEAVPYQVVAVFFTSSSFAGASAGSLSLDDITAFGPSLPPEGQVIEGFEELSGWAAMTNQKDPLDRAFLAPDAAHTGRAGLMYQWEQPFSSAQRGVHLPPGPFPLPAIGGPGHVPGQIVRLKYGKLAVPVQIAAVTEYFPTVFPSRRPFYLLDLEDYQEYQRSLPETGVKEVDEFWLAVDPEAVRDDVVARVEARFPGFVSIRDRQQEAGLAQRDPLAGGGWNGLTILSMVAVGISVLITLAMHSIVTVRGSRTDLAVASALGFSRRQLFVSMAVERTVIAAIAICAGAAIGYWPGLEVVALLDLTPNGVPAIPPLAPSVEVWVMAAALAGLSVAAVGSLAFSVAASLRLDTAQVLRGQG